MYILPSCHQTTFQSWWTIECSMKETLINAGTKAEEFKSFMYDWYCFYNYCFLF